MSRTKKTRTPHHVEIEILITASQLNGLLKHNRGISKQVASLTGTAREKIAYAVDKQGLHKGAFAIIKSFEKKEPEALLELWTHLVAYMDMSGIKQRMDSVTRLDLGDKEPGGRPSKVALLEPRRKQTEPELHAG